MTTKLIVFSRSPNFMCYNRSSLLSPRSPRLPRLIFSLMRSRVKRVSLFIEKKTRGLLALQVFYGYLLGDKISKR